MRLKRGINKLLLVIPVFLILIIFSAAQTTITDLEITTDKITATEVNTVLVVEGNTNADIQAAIDAANAQGGGKVFIPPGVYILSTPILLYNNVYLSGVQGSTYLTTRPGIFTGDALFKSASRDTGLATGNIRTGISDMIIKAAGSLNSGKGVIGIDLTGMEFSRIENIYLWGSGLFEGTAILISNAVEDPNNPGTYIYYKSSTFNTIKNFNANQKWSTFIKYVNKNAGGPVHHNYGINLVSQAEAIIDVTESDPGTEIGMALFGCYLYGNGLTKPPMFKDNYMINQIVFIECNSEKKSFSISWQDQLLIYGKMTIPKGGLIFGGDDKLHIGTGDIKKTINDAPASALPIPPLFIANDWNPGLRLAQFSGSGDSSDRMYSRFFDIEMTLGADYKLIMAHQGKSSEGITIDNQGKVGIGTETPVEKLDVDGVLRLTPTDSPGTCDATTKGSFYYDLSLKEPCLCDSSTWNQVDGGGLC